MKHNATITGLGAIGGLVLCGMLTTVLSGGALGEGTAPPAEPGAPSDQAESVRSYPPDTTPYYRGAVPEDFQPGGKPAVPPGLLRAPGQQKKTGTSAPQGGRSEIETLTGTSALAGVSGAGGEPAILIVDPVVSNTNPNVNSADMANDGETSIAINPANPNEIVISAFSGPLNNNNTGSWNFGNANAIIYHSLDGGLTWTQEFVPPPNGIPVTGVNDWTFDYGRNSRMSGTVLNNSDVITGTTTSPAILAAWSWNDVGGVTQITNTTGVGNSDQPWLLVNPEPTMLTQDNVYVAYDNFSGSPVDMQVAVSYGLNPPNFTTDVTVGSSSGCGTNPGFRLAEDPRTGYMYALWQRCTGGGNPSPATIDFRLNRSTDGGNTWTLNGSATGIVVVSGADSYQSTPKFGTVNALLGGIDHAAVDPNTGTLYYVYGDRDNSSGVQRIALKRVTSDGMGGVVLSTASWVSPDVNDAAIPSAAVVNNDTLGVFYYTFDGFSSDDFPIFTAWLALSDDQGATFTQHRLLTFLSSAKDNGRNRQRVLGDYMQMKAVGNCFYGSFTGNGAPFGRIDAMGNPISNHDPIFFKTCTGPQLQVNQSVTVPDACIGGVATADLEICNAGLEPLILTAILPNNPAFSVTPKSGNFPVNISPDACFTFEVNFSPADGDDGPQNGTLTIVSNDPAVPETTVAVSSTGMLPDLAATLQNDGVFGDVAVDDYKLLNLEVLNQSSVCELSVNNLARDSLSSEFAFAGFPGGLSFPVLLPQGANVDLPLVYMPTDFGADNDTFSLISDDPGSPTQVAVHGNSPAPEITVSGDQDFGEVCADTTSERTVDICNVGTLNPLAVDATLIGAGCDNFEIVGNPFPADISHDFCVSMTVKYTPTGVGDHDSCDLRITSNDVDEGVINLALSGSTPAPDIDVAGNLHFPATVVQSDDSCNSPRAFPVQNNGTCPLSITNIGITMNAQEYSLDALPSFPINLDHGELAGDGDLRVVFAPEVLDYQSKGQITVTYEDDPITHHTTDVMRNLCGEATHTGARVLVTHNGTPLDTVKKIQLSRVNANRNKNNVDTNDVSRNVMLQTIVADPPCPEVKYHTEYGAEGNPIQLLPGSYTVTVQANIDGKNQSKTVGFDVSTCDFNPSIVVNFD